MKRVCFGNSRICNLGQYTTYKNADNKERAAFSSRLQLILKMIAEFIQVTLTHVKKDSRNRFVLNFCLILAEIFGCKVAPAFTRLLEAGH